MEDEEELAAFLADSWRQVAPRRPAAAHPELDVAGDGAVGEDEG
ncbi:hypothetical protein ACIP3B_24725 [Streptomyces anulatus]